MDKNQLTSLVSQIQENDEQLARELEEIRKKEKFQEESRNLKAFDELTDGSVNEVMSPSGIETEFALETIVLRVGRPVLAVKNDHAVLDFQDIESEVWRARLQKASEKLTSAAKAVGRVELENDPRFDWVGTGWLVDPSIIVTNRHVADVFVENKDQKFTFKKGQDGLPKKANIDFIEEIDSTDELEFDIAEILHVEPPGGPDIAFFRIDMPPDSNTIKHIALSKTAPVKDQQIATIGYPAMDSRIPDQKLMTKIFGDIYDKKRLAPGQITGITNGQITHDCSTSGGCSGAAVIDLESGDAVGLHFAGRFLENNFAVPASVISEKLDGVKKNMLRPLHKDITPSPMDRIVDRTLQEPDATQKISVSIPLKLELDIRISLQDTAIANAATTQIPLPALSTSEDFFAEAKPEDYRNRMGFDTSFLGDDNTVSLPTFGDGLKNDVLHFEYFGERQHILKYTHFSVVMSESRRQCFYSAVNIDGKTSIPMKRGPWRVDPRILPSQQILKECYGNFPKYSRGHMTRREDPIWGSQHEAEDGNSDSMHVTNAVPQIQSMNAGIWLALENYALQNARKDDMRISVITGPVFGPGDKTQYGVVIPEAFWKIIVFIHDKTKKLTATGYKISQKDFIPEEEIVFGAHKTDQVSISSIEKETNLSFGNLSQADPLGKMNEGAHPSNSNFSRELNSLLDITFI